MNRRAATKPAHRDTRPAGPTIRVPRPQGDHELTVIVPAYNEELRLPATLLGLADYLNSSGIDYRVVVVDDGSRDRTSTLTDSFGRRFSTIRQPQNGYQAIRSGACEVVFGARDLRESVALAPRRLLRSLATGVFRGIVRRLVSREVTDTQCGLKLFSIGAAREIFSRVTIEGFAFDAEVVYLTHRLKLPFQRIPVTLINEYSSTLSLSRHALPMLLDVIGLRWRAVWGRYDVAPSTPATEPVETPRRAAA
jgi:dolichyl-phosphate beta-glucosyltransferase